MEKNTQKRKKPTYPVHKEICRWKWGNNPTKDEFKGQRVALRARSHYVSSFAWIEELVGIAMRDFPLLKKEDIEIVKYGGRIISGFSGIEFNPGNWKIPAGYEKVTQQQPTK